MEMVYRRYSILQVMAILLKLLLMDLTKHFYLPPADRPGMGDYKMPCVRACVRSSHFYTSLSIS